MNRNEANETGQLEDNSGPSARASDGGDSADVNGTLHNMMRTPVMKCFTFSCSLHNRITSLSRFKNPVYPKQIECSIYHRLNKIHAE